MLNKTIIQGRLTKDAELRHTQTGKAVASFTIAWSERFKDQERKLFLPCVAWGGTGEFISKWFRKGDQIIVEGILSTRDWTDSNGNKRQTIELTVTEAHFAGSKGSNQTTPAVNNPPVVECDEPEFEELIMDNGDFPF